MVIGEPMPQFSVEKPKNNYKEEEIELIKKYTIHTTPIGEDPVKAFNDSYPNEGQRVKILEHWKNLERGGAHMIGRDVVNNSPNDEPRMFNRSDDSIYGDDNKRK